MTATRIIAPPPWATITPKNTPVTSPPGHSRVPISFSGTDHTRERHSATTPTTHPIPTKNAPSISSTIVDHSLPSAGARFMRSAMAGRDPLRVMGDLMGLMTPRGVDTVGALRVAGPLGGGGGGGRGPPGGAGGGEGG